MKVPNASLLSQESILKGRFAPSGRIEGFTAEIGASGSYCPQHATLPVDVTYFDISEHSAPSPFLVRRQGRSGPMGEVSGDCTQTLHILRGCPSPESVSQATTYLKRLLAVLGAIFNPQSKEGKKQEPLQVYKQAGCCPAISWLLLHCHLCVAACSSFCLKGLSWASSCRLVLGVPGERGLWPCAGSQLSSPWAFSLSHVLSFAPGSD